MWESILNSKSHRAQRIISDPERMERLAKDSFSLIRGKKKFSEVQSEAVLLINMVKDTVKGRYKGLGKKNVIMIVAGLLYLVNPMDIVPDFIFGIGFADDLGVLVYVISRLSEEIARYRQWKKPQKEEVETPDLEGYTVIEEDA
ncbi:hypothetical protein PEPNEM18_01215 [Aedoeadaptatus nemausensis]|uniref:DUF1232 domain-containing protein n=1 Tax=Aedoeadaptatus nemausensis TaxID=2582829 RepID=A0A6V6Y4Q3_9FIRM|nr:YkvA family protein [Peptoniphilus nemausensis]CAC9932377.1 hypothetical protein PEPNEM18_01215 [Peptoniphilus nemausensis]